MEKHANKKTVCIVCTSKDAYSETFIRAHIERLPARVIVLYGMELGHYRHGGNDRQLLTYTPERWLLRAIFRRVLRLPEKYFEKAALKRFLLKEKVDAVLAEYGITGLEVMDVCVGAGVPLICHFHGFDAYRRSVTGKSGEHYRDLFQSSTAVIAVSRDMEHQLLHLGAPRDRLYYNTYGVDMSLFNGADPAENPPFFVAVGRFVDKKAPQVTLLAFKAVLERLPKARLIMIGDGPLWEACKQVARALKISDTVQFPGPLSHGEVAAMMRKARAFVQHSVRTSYGDSEGTPVVVLEAGATGLPVVATRHGGICDVVIEGETGLLVDEGDVDSMAESMIRLGENPALAAELGLAARKRICAEFSVEKSIQKLWNIIEDAIQKNGKPWAG